MKDGRKQASQHELLWTLEILSQLWQKSSGNPVKLSRGLMLFGFVHVRIEMIVRQAMFGERDAWLP